MARFRHLIVGLLALAGLLAVTSPVLAQTTVNSTTLSAPIDNKQQTIPLTSVTNMSTGARAGNGDLIVIDREGMQINAIDTVALTATVRRGVYGSAAAHVTGAVVYSGPTRRFYFNQVVGACTATAEEYLPHIVLSGANSVLGGDVYDCKDGEWVRLRDSGYRVGQLGGRTDGGTLYVTSGAITVKPGLTLIGSGGALAMTLVNPTIDQNGLIMIITAQTAQTHTVTYTAGFGGGTTARDVATFGGAINDSMTIVAYNGIWWLVSTRNVTLG